MKKLALIITCLFIQIGCFAQYDYYSDFLMFYNSKDTSNQLIVLNEWQNKSPKDAELFTSFFNYHYSKSRNKKFYLSNEKSIEDDSMGQATGNYAYFFDFNQKDLKKAFEIIDKGIELYPNRLDMRFGKIYALGEIKYWQRFTSEIIKKIRQSSVNNNHWTWTKHEKRNGGQKTFLLGIQNYQTQLYNTGNDDLLNNMKDIANEVLTYYPTHIESLSNLSITYVLKKQYDKAIEILLRAEKINPKDFIVLNNIAHTYTLMENKTEAFEYYEKVMKFGDVKSKEIAKQKIAELKL